jgi:ketosteroid isomerase-like protein
MAETENLRIVRLAFEKLGAQDMQGFMDTLAEDVIWETPGPADALPFAGVHRGRDEVAAWFTKLNELEEVQRFEPEDFLAKGDKVVVLGRSRVRVKATDRVIDDHWFHVYTVRDGKIAHFREAYDTAAEVAAHHCDSPAKIWK